VIAGDAFDLGPFSVIALPASDGLGSPQVSWLIEADGKRVIHCGDTLRHGAWWDVVPAVMTAEQAVEAARALQARLLVPIHGSRWGSAPSQREPAGG